MATFGNNVNYNEVQSIGENIPAGFYQAIVVESGGKSDNPNTCPDGLVTSKNGKGRYLPMTFEVIEGDFKGRQIFKNFNLENVNTQAVNIARSEIKSLLLAIGWDFSTKPSGPDDTSEIHMIPLTIQVVIRVDKNTGDERNEIKKFMPRAAPGSAPMQRSSAPVSPAATPQAPWQRSAN